MRKDLVRKFAIPKVHNIERIYKSFVKVKQGEWTSVCKIEMFAI